MVTPNKITTNPSNQSQTELKDSSWTNFTTTPRQEYDNNNQTRNTILYIVLAIVVLAGGYYMYSYGLPSTAPNTTMMKTDTVPLAKAPTTSTTVVPVAPANGATTAVPAAPATDTMAAPATPPASGTAPAPDATKTP